MKRERRHGYGKTQTAPGGRDRESLPRDFWNGSRADERAADQREAAQLCAARPAEDQRLQRNRHLWQAHSLDRILHGHRDHSQRRRGRGFRSISLHAAADHHRGEDDLRIRILGLLHFPGTKQLPDDDRHRVTQSDKGDIKDIVDGAGYILSRYRVQASQRIGLIQQEDPRCPQGFIDQKRKQIQISATYISDNNFWQSYEVGIRIVGRPFVISDLEAGEAFDFDELKIEEFRHGSTINLNEKEYRMLSGSITVESVNNKQVKLRFNDLTFELKVSTFLDNDYYPENPQKNVVTGTALFHNHLSSEGEWVPFY